MEEDVPEELLTRIFAEGTQPGVYEANFRFGPSVLRRMLRLLAVEDSLYRTQVSILAKQSPFLPLGDEVISTLEVANDARRDCQKEMFKCLEAIVGRGDIGENQ